MHNTYGLSAIQYHEILRRHVHFFFRRTRGIDAEILERVPASCPDQRIDAGS